MATSTLENCLLNHLKLNKDLMTWQFDPLEFLYPSKCIYNVKKKGIYENVHSSCIGNNQMKITEENPNVHQ